MLRLAVALFFAATAAAPIPFATYLGGTGTDDCDGIATDSSGDLYLACHSDSADFPGIARRPPPVNRDSMDAIVVKVDGRTGRLLWATRIGGSAWDALGDLAIAPDHSVYALGSTRSTDFPTTPDAVQRRFAGPDRDVCLVRLDPAGKLVYSTLLGSSQNDESDALVLAPDGTVFIGGVTFSSSDFPGVRRGELGPRGKQDAFISRLHPGDPHSLETVILGGSSVDRITGLALDRSGNLFASGYTSSPDFPVKNALQPKLAGQMNTFVARFRAAGLSLTFATYLGGSKIDGASSIAIDRDGNPIVTGVTSSDDFPSTPSAFQPHRRGPIDAFLTKLDRDGARILWSTYYGGSKPNSDQFLSGSMQVDDAGRVWLSGMTASTDLPTRTPVQPANAGGDFDGFLAAFSNDGARLCYATYLGGSAHEILEAVAIAKDRVYATGITASVNIPVSLNATQPKYGGGPYDAVIFGIGLPPISSCR